MKKSQLGNNLILAISIVASFLVIGGPILLCLGSALIFSSCKSERLEERTNIEFERDECMDILGDCQKVRDECRETLKDKRKDLEECNAHVSTLIKAMESQAPPSN